MLRLLRLENFRCHEFFDLSAPGAIKVRAVGNWVHLAGSNGAGKTSVLEAISLLAPGRGLRGAESGVLQRAGAVGGWRACFEFEDRSLLLTPGARGRKIQDSTGERGWHEDVSVFWVTPQSVMGFFGDKSERRKCIDRWISGVDREYHERLVRYKRAYAEWLRAVSGRMDVAVCSVFERMMEEDGRLINARRQEWQALLEFTFGLTRVEIEDVQCVQDWGLARRAGIAGGVHRAEVVLWQGQTSTEYASTGECKLMLFGLIYAVACTHPSKYKILLLDDWSENFDASNRRIVEDVVAGTPWLQVWSSGVGA